MGVQEEQRVKEDFRRLQYENRNCPHCQGAGLVIVFHPAWAGDRIGHTTTEAEDGRVIQNPFAAEIGAHCLCAVGRWIRERVELEEQRRIPRVEDIVAGTSRWLMGPPQHRDHPRDVIPIAPTRSDINGIFRRPS